jgi:hypothetical protein
MKTKENKTQKDVLDIVTLALSKKVKINMYAEKTPFSKKCVASFAAEIYIDMSPTDVWYEINKVLERQDIFVYKKNFQEVESLIEGFHSL